MEANRHLYLISFNAKTNKFITNIEGMGDIIKNNNIYGIINIKAFDNTNDKFVRLSKETLKARASYYTHTLIELTKSGYIKD